MVRYTITIEVEGPNELELEDVLEQLLDAGAIQNLITETNDDAFGLDFVITKAACDAGVEDPEES